MSRGEDDALVEDLLAGHHRALARTITKIENRAPGYRDLVASLHDHTGDADVVGITGSPGAGKSTLVDKLAKVYRDRGLSVGVIAVDPSSPFTGGAVLGDRIRMAATVGDMDVFFRSMSARGQLGGLSTATADAVKALDAFGKDRILVETVGAGQNEVDIVRTADTVVVLVQPGSGDDVQMLKAGILEIGDVFVVNKADMAGADRTVSELEEMIHFRRSPSASAPSGHHGPSERARTQTGSGTRADSTGTASRDRSPDADAADASDRDASDGDAGADGDADGDVAADETPADWVPSVVETVATTGDGIDDLVETLESHRTYLRESGRLEEKARNRYASEIRQLLRNDVGELVETELERQGGIDSLATAVHDRQTDPYTLADEVLDPVRECVQEERPRRDDGDDGDDGDDE